MNKILLIAVVGLLLVSCSFILLGIYAIPEQTIILKNISPQIICYGGGC